MNSKLTILLCTYNGELFLEKQLNSIQSQSYKHWKIIVSDDGSSDKTLSILKKFQNKWGIKKMKIVNGPGKGFSQNFFSLICMKDLSSDFYAFADQDDIWEPEKLSTAIKFFINEDYSMPLLYCSRTKLIDEKQSSIGYSPLFKKKPTIYNALVQSIAGGNTMIINRKTLELAASIGNNNKIISHDWLLYLMVTSVNGKVKYDEWPSVLYRQHGNNKIGNNMMLSARLKRLYFFLRGDLKSWIDQNLILLEKIEAHLSMEAKEALNHLIKLREMPWYEVLMNFQKIKFYRQTSFGHIALIIGFILKRV
jgi:glycosyltransferase involved in cell wall biosynthesis